MKVGSELRLLRCLLLKSFCILSKNTDDFLDRHTEALLDPSEVADGLHLPTIQTQNESAFDRNDLQQPGNSKFLD